MTETELNALLDVRSENEHIEFKEAKNNFRFEKLVDYCVALANEGGGCIVLGVTDKPPRRVVGTQAFATPEKTVAGIHERLHIKVLWQEIQHADGRVLMFEVPSRPTGHPLQYDGRYWMRAGEELVAMTPDQLKRIIDEASLILSINRRAAIAARRWWSRFWMFRGITICASGLCHQPARKCSIL